MDVNTQGTCKDSNRKLLCRYTIFSINVLKIKNIASQINKNFPKMKFFSLLLFYHYIYILFTAMYYYVFYTH